VPHRVDRLLSPFVLLSLAGFVSGMTIRIAEPLLPRIAEHFDVGVGHASVIVTGFVVAYGLFQLVHGPLGDRIGKLRAVSIACIGASAACAICAVATSLWMLAGFRFLSGMTAGAVIPLSLAYVGDTFPFEDRQAALARYLFGALGGQTVGPLVGGVFSDLVGWRGTFLVPAAAFLAIGLLLAPTARRQPRPAPAGGSFNPLRGYGPLLRQRHVRIVLVSVFVEGALFLGTFGFFGAYLRDDFDLSYTVIGLVLASYGIGGLVYAVFARGLILRLGQHGLVLIGGAIVAACFLVVGLTPWWEACVPALVVLGGGFYMLHTTFQARATEMAPERRGAAMSAFVFFIFSGQTAGVAAIGAIVDGTGYRSLIVASGIGLGLLAVYFRVRLPLLEAARTGA
jgi:MFS transporter, YNFM family, putative membrane transport protein